MKKLTLLLAIAAVMAASPARADWSTDLQNAIKTGHYSEINVIAANNPDAQGDIAMALLTAAKDDAADHPDTSAKLFTLATPFVAQITPAQAPQAGGLINQELALAGNPGFQKNNPHGAKDIFIAALAMSSTDNIVTGSPNLHNLVLADASDYLDKNPSDDKDMQDPINLALQIGSPPPIGPHGFLTPSPE